MIAKQSIRIGCVFLGLVAWVPTSLCAEAGEESAFRYQEAKLPNYLSGHRWSTEGSPLTQMQLPVLPEESVKHMVVPEGFEVSLFASEPDIRPPLAMAWDERGRLWLCESVDYPNDIQPAGQGNDTIRICEDTDGDGRADHFTVFADKLSICTSIAFSNGGVIVHQAPDTLFLKDVDGDDRADVRQVLYTGWSVGDTHAGPSNLRYGLDNWFWGLVGYSGFEGEIGGLERNFRSGFYRFRPDAAEFEFLRSNNNNNWGLGFSEEGLVFGSTANRNPSVYLSIPNRYYERVRGWSGGTLTGIADSFLFEPITDKVRQVDHHGGYTAAAGHALYTARTYPKRYWNRTAFVTGPTGKLIGTFDLRARGAGFQASNTSNLMASVDEWTAPINAEVGPDGHVWFIDWYNYIVQHNPTPVGYKRGQGNAYMTDLRDRQHGRVYRVVYRNGRASRTYNLGTTSGRLRALQSENQLWRSHAQRLLVEAGDPGVRDALIDLIDDQELDSIGLNVGAIHALWTLEGLGLTSGADRVVHDTLLGALEHPSAGVRRNALMVLPKNAANTAEILRAGLLADGDSQVRLATLLALADSPPDPSVARAVIQMLQTGWNARDPHLVDAATMAAANNATSFLNEVLRAGDAIDVAVFDRVIGRVAAHFASGGDVRRVGGLLRLAGMASDAVRQSFLDGLITGTSAENPPRFTDGDRSYLQQWIGTLTVDSQDTLLALAQRWGVGALFSGNVAGVRQALQDQLEDSNADAEARIEAAHRLVRLDDSRETIARVVGVIDLSATPDFTLAILRLLGESESDAVVPQLAGAWNRLTPAGRRTAVSTMLTRFDWTMAMLSAIGRGEIPRTELSAAEWQQLIYHPNTTIQLRAGNMGIGAANLDRDAVFQAKRAALELEGDSERGKALYELLCAQCHQLGANGGKVGPELTGIGARPAEEILIEIVDPNRSLEANYRSWTVETTDGRTLTGRLDSEDRESIELLDAAGQRHVVARRSIESLSASDLSLMPVGLIDELPASDVASLLRFLRMSH